MAGIGTEEIGSGSAAAAAAAPVKRGRGRPKGSKNRPKAAEPSGGGMHAEAVAAMEALAAAGGGAEGSAGGAEVLEVGLRNMVAGLGPGELDAWRRLVADGDGVRRRREAARKAEKYLEMTSGYAGSDNHVTRANAGRKRDAGWKSAKEARRWERESRVTVSARVARLLLWRSVGGSYRTPGPNCGTWRELAAAMSVSEDVRSAWEANQRLCAERLRGKAADVLEGAVDGEEVSIESARTSRWALERLETEVYGDPRFAGQTAGGGGAASGAGGGGIVINIVADAAESLARKPVGGGGRAVVMEGV